MPATKRYREWNPFQSYLLPPSPSEWLPEDHLAYFILDVVEILDLSPIEDAIQAKDPRGTRPYDPRMMTSLLLYGYCVGVRSSRKIETASYEDLAFRVIAGGQHPDHTVISEFRRQHLDGLGGIFVQTAQLAQKAGLVKLGRVALDGTKVQANASKHKAMSYGRMLKAEAELEVEVGQLLAEAERIDREEDERYGRYRRGDELPEELRRREDRLRRIREAKEALEAEAAEARAVLLEERAENQRQKAKTAEDSSERKRAATRAAKAQRNFTDPDSRIMKRDGAYLQGYNCQAVVDEAHQIVVACAVTNQAPDPEHLPPLTEQINVNLGAFPDQLLGDTGYWDEEHVSFCEQREIDPYIATGRQKHGEKLPPVRGRPPKDLDAKGRMQRKLRTKRGREIYARRKAIVEPVFGQMREVQGLGRFLLRGLDKVPGEWQLFNAGHNLLKIFRAQIAAA